MTEFMIWLKGFGRKQSETRKTAKRINSLFKYFNYKKYLHRNFISQINGYEHTVNRNIEIIINSLDSIGNLNELEETFRWQNKYYINDSNKLLKDLNDFVVEKLSELRKGVS